MLDEGRVLHRLAVRTLTSRSTYPRGLILLIKELYSTYYHGVFSPEQGSLRQLDRAEPEVVAKSATLQERGPGLETRIIDCGNIEPAS